MRYALALLVVGLFANLASAQVIVSYYPPAPVATTAYYAPTTAYYAPTTAYYAPAPVTAYYAPAPVAVAPVYTTRYRPFLGGGITRTSYYYAPVAPVAPVTYVAPAAPCCH